MGILDREGLDALSMRRVAQELGTGAASLYAHVARKGELLELLFDEVVGEIPVPVPDPERWQEQILQVYRDARAAFARHGDVARVAQGNIPLGPNALVLSEAQLAIMRSGGVPDQMAAWTVDVLGLYLNATAVEAAILANRERGAKEDFYAQVGAYLATLPRSRFPNMVELTPMLMAGDGEQRFEFGLELLVRGLAVHATRPRGDDAPAAQRARRPQTARGVRAAP